MRNAEDCRPVTLSLGEDVSLLRIVAYPLSSVERLLERAVKDSDGDVVCRLSALSDQRIQRRMLGMVGAVTD